MLRTNIVLPLKLLNLDFKLKLQWTCSRGPWECSAGKADLTWSSFSNVGFLNKICFIPCKQVAKTISVDPSKLSLAFWCCCTFEAIFLHQFSWKRINFPMVGFLYEFFWLTWLRLWVPSQAETVITYLLRSCWKNYVVSQNDNYFHSKWPWSWLSGCHFVNLLSFSKCHTTVIVVPAWLASQIWDNCETNLQKNRTFVSKKLKVVNF